MKLLQIGNRLIGPEQKTFIIAEMSANHNKNFDKAVKIIEAAKQAGADAVKLQTYKPDTITMNCNNEYFQIQDTIWKGKNLYQLYEEAYTPWEWQPKLKEIADRLGIILFSTPFDHTAVAFLESMEVPAYKIASFENNDIPLIEKVAQTGKPIILSTGLASLEEIDEAVKTIKRNGNSQIALLKCTSAYPAPPNEMNLKTIPHMANTFKVPVGLSDHTLGSCVSVAAIALGSAIIEKHLTLSRSDPGPDNSFSMEPHEFEEMVSEIRIAEQALGKINYDITSKQKENRIFRRSLFVVKDVNKGEFFTKDNIRSIRPGHGIHTRHFKDIIGKKAKKSIDRGTPLNWDLVQ